MQRYQTTNLFYNKYVFKLRLKNDLAAMYRGLKFDSIKTKIDEMHREAEAQLPITNPFRMHKKTVSLETFMDNLHIYQCLLEGEGKCIARCEANNLDIYTNHIEILEKIMARVKAIALYEPASDSNLDYLLKNPNTHIVEGPIKWRYKAWMGGSVDSNFSNFCTANKNNIKIGDKALSSIVKNHYTDGYYFLTTDERYLMLARIALGGKITKIVKFVTEAEMHK